jgi:hypothetical protein
LAADRVRSASFPGSNLHLFYAEGRNELCDEATATGERGRM